MKRKLLGAALAVAGLTLAPCLSAAGGQATPAQKNELRQPSAGSDSRQSQGTPTLTGADSLKGVQVRSLEGEPIGAIDQLVIDTAQGKLAYLIVSPADSGEKIIVPWNAVQTQQSRGEGQMAAPTVTLIVSREQLQQAPKEDLQTLDREKEREIHRFYGVSPYWEDSSGSPQMIIEPAPALPPDHPPVLPPGHPPIPGQTLPQGGEAR